MKILAVGDSYMPTHYFQRVFVNLEDTEHVVTYLQVDDKPFAPATPSDLRIKEFQGVPEELCKHMAGVDVLVVHGAPVTDAVLDASPALKLVGCARGGPVNVDVEAVTARRLSLVNTPGKNAEAVADQTLAFLVMLARGFPRAQRFLEKGHQLNDNWEGARFIGSDLRRHTLGLVGYGQVGQRVGHRALAFGMTVIAYDPYLDVRTVRGDRADGDAGRATGASGLRLRSRPRHLGEPRPVRRGDLRQDEARLVFREHCPRDPRRRGCTGFGACLRPARWRRSRRRHAERRRRVGIVCSAMEMSS